MKVRLDKLLVERGIAATRERAQAMIFAGRVLVNEQKVDKPGSPVAPDALLRMLGEDPLYVGRGGLKLEAALKHWQVDLSGRFCADVGASTGGFTDCMLQHGASTVLAIDTGYGQIAQKLRADVRVSLMERTNARHLKPGDLPAGISFVAMDVSFISATLVLPPVVAAAGSSLQEIVVLVKPQFEAGREYVGKGGIVRDAEGHQLAIDRVRACLERLTGREIDLIDSPILGAEGNREFLLHALLNGPGEAEEDTGSASPG
ncbi:RNA binding methyltransferase FtsJ like [Acidisarcina polymorpha]|uniref:RNA binding methyltransferase FtsJ like n=1 Tax=Acidisarcina polymorpha TaxID=2211140 RepID=A0A2Z5FW34_9BACT|nr:TlyA family RNA methyltransferase [Acidisarcina polymorpha]AXC11099.1 RNA binding methyltransferase FtsJ like [Acidisarcina polymorpha]